MRRLFVAKTTRLILIALPVMAVVFAALTSSATQAQNNTIDLLPIEDSHVKSGYPAKNYGTEANIAASNYSSNTHLAYLKFDLSPLAGQQISSVQLIITPSLERTVEKELMLVSANSWQEGGITWQNRPALANKIGNLPSTKVQVGHPIVINLDPSPFAQLSGDQISLAITNVTNSKNTLYFYSRESATPPRLRIVTGSGSPGAPGVPSAPPATQLTGDINGDGVVNVEDFKLALAGIDKNDAKLDLNNDGKVDIFDTNLVITAIVQPPAATSAPVPTATSSPTPTATATPVLTPTPTPTTPTPPATTPTPLPPPSSTPPTPTPAGAGIWLSPAQIAQLPTSGNAWNNLLSYAAQNTSSPNLGNQDDNTDAAVVAKALVYARTGNQTYRTQVIQALEKVQITPLPPGEIGILAVARNLAPYVIAADLVNYRTSNFENWVRQTRDTVYSGSGPALSVITCHERRPNNFGTHCGTSRMAADLYLNDMADFAAAATVFHGWTGNTNAYQGFVFGSDLSWHCNTNNPVPLNPQGCTKNGNNLDGVLPDDQRRGGGYTWPAPKENYVWEALQGAVAQAWILHRHGYPAFAWQQNALQRAVTWLHNVNNFPAVGDDTGTPWIINKMYGTNFPTATSKPGKNGLGFYDWSHQ